MSARLRLWLLFGGLALAIGGGAGGRGLAGGERARRRHCCAGRAPRYVLVACRRGCGTCWSATWIAPSIALAREIELLIHAKAERRITPLAATASGRCRRRSPALAERWRTGEAEQRAALDRAMARLREQQSRLEALLRDLSDGVIACTADRRILLFNDAALGILDDHPELGLEPTARSPDRPGADHARVRFLCEAQGRGGRAGPAGGREEFVCATADGAKLLRCRMALILGDGRSAGRLRPGFRRCDLAPRPGSSSARCGSCS